MKKGFILLEVLIASAIGAIISGMLVSSLFQAYRFRRTVDNLATLSLRIATVQRQFERDLAGAFIPVEAQQNKNKKDKDKKAQDKEKKSGGSNSDKTLQDKSQDKAKEGKGSDKKKQKKPLEKVFYSVNKTGDKQKNLELLTCITNNPLQIFWSARSGRAKPKVARVVYKLAPEKGRTDSFVLMRQEGGALDFKAYGADAEKKIRAYPVLDGIKQITAQYTVTVEKKDETKKKEKKVTREVKQFDTWGTKITEEKKESELPLVPHVVELRVVLWDTQFKDSTTTVVTVPIVPSIDALRIPEKQEPEEKKEKKEQKTKPSQPDAIQQRFKKTMQDIKRLTQNVKQQPTGTS